MGVARQRLELYRQVLPEEKRQELTQMLTEVHQLEGKLRQEANQPASHDERAKQGNAVTQWWERLNGWFKRRF